MENVVVDPQGQRLMICGSGRKRADFFCDFTGWDLADLAEGKRCLTTQMPWLPIGPKSQVSLLECVEKRNSGGDMVEGCCSDRRPPCGWLGVGGWPRNPDQRWDHGPTNLPSIDFQEEVVVNQTAEGVIMNGCGLT